MREPGHCVQNAGDDQPRRDAGAELRRRNDGLPQLHGRLAGMVLQCVANLVGDDGSCGHRQPGAAGHHAGRREGRRVGHLGADPQHLAAGIVVVGQLTGSRLDLDVLQALAIQEPASEVEGVDVDARVHLGPLCIG